VEGGLLDGRLGWGLAGVVLLALLREPQRTGVPEERTTWRGVFAHPMAPVLVCVFLGANFVAMVFLTWMPSFLNRKFGMTLAMAGLNSTAWLRILSVLGVLADRLVRGRPGGRMLAQAIGPSEALRSCSCRGGPSRRWFS
jgi:hypothetical protein